MPYRPRIVDLELRQALGAIGAVLVEGPKGCGKTETARQVANSEVLLDVDAQARASVALDPRQVLTVRNLSRGMRHHDHGTTGPVASPSAG